MSNSAHIRLKRAYDPPEPSDGLRVLVDRLWARGVSKENANLDAWMKELGPTDELRKWFGHRLDRWDVFVKTYRTELAAPVRQLLLAELQGVAKKSVVTLVYGARDTKENEAVVLQEYLFQDKARPTGAWDATTRLLITASVVVAAHHGALAPAPVLKLFASPVLGPTTFDDALHTLQTSGDLRESSREWELTARGGKRVRQLATME